MQKGKLNQSDNAPCSILISEIKSEPVEWIWRPRIPKAKLGLVSGDPGVGKSVLGLDVGAHVSIGQEPYSLKERTPGNVLILSAEDDPADTIRPRLEAAGADLERISVIRMVPDGENGERTLTIPGNTSKLEAEIVRRKIVLVIIDPLMAYVPANYNSWKDQDIRRALAPLAGLADRTSAAILLIGHLNKKTGGNPLYRGGGSIGLAGAARSVLLLGRDPNDPETRVLVGTKSNLGKPPNPLGFTIVDKNGYPTVEWLGKVDLTADELLNGTSTPTGVAVAFLRKLLKEGPVSSKEIKTLSQEDGISTRALESARQQLGIDPKKSGFGEGGSWSWSLPQKKK